MMLASWGEIRGKIKHACGEIYKESNYEKLGSSVDKVKETPLLNMAVKMSLLATLIIGPRIQFSHRSVFKANSEIFIP
jgi:hypothetical protein